MAYTSTEIETPAAQTQPNLPQLNGYETPDVTATKPTIDTANTGYQTPTTNFQNHNINAGLLDFDPTASKDLTFDGRDINTSNISANVNEVTPDFAKADNFLTDGAFVENRVAGLLEDPNNTLNQRMKANGLAEAGARGLQNTSMGVTIGQTVMADKAIQIASQDATTQAQGDLNRQGSTYQAQGKVQDTKNQSSLAEQTAKINSELANQQAGQTWDSTQQKAAIQGDLNKQNANIAGAQTTQNAQYASDARIEQGLLEGAAKEQAANISAELAGLESVSSQNLSILQSKLEAANLTTKDQNAAMMQQYSAQQEIFRTTLNNEYNKATSQAQLNAAQREALSGAMTEMANNYEISVQNILLDPNLNAESKNSAISKINMIFNQDMQNISSVFGASYTNTKTG